MFYHSVKVPRLYKTAAKILKKASEGSQSVKQLVYGEKHPIIKALFALVLEAFQRSDDIDSLFKKSKLLVKEPRLDFWLTRILITELLWGKKRLSGDSKPIKTILAYKQILEAHISDLNSNPKRLSTAPAGKPRYVRINTITMSTNEVIDQFQEENWSLIPYNTNKNDYKSFLNEISTLNSNEFIIDFHIPDLLVFPPKTEFYHHDAYKNSTILLQDKASCLPVLILNPEPGSTVLDMCAAPGMKTTHIAAKLNNEGTIYAVELNENRFAALNNIVQAAGATCVKTINRDVLTLTGNDCPDVEYILVDPSCSGSGMTDRIDLSQGNESITKPRLDKLAGFQIKILRHALNVFPNAKRVVYSTCSIYPEENEDVVRQVLETCTKFKLLKADQFINDWLHYGSEEFGDIGRYCLYTKSEVDLTNGFFVAVFERLEEGESNQFLNRELFKLHKKENKRQKRFHQNYDDNEVKTSKKKERKKRKIFDENKMDKCLEEMGNENQMMPSKKKKKKRHTNEAKVQEEEEETINCEDGDSEVKTKKKKKKRKESLAEKKKLGKRRNIEIENKL